MSLYERLDVAASTRANNIADAQRRYAYWQMFLAAAGVGFTGVAAFFAWRATHWAKEAARHTKRSADADNHALTETRNAAAAARTAFLADQRPWVGVLDARVEEILVDETGARADVVLCLKNTGRSPALNVGFTARLTAEKRADDTADDVVVRFRHPDRAHHPDVFLTIFPDQEAALSFAVICERRHIDAFPVVEGRRFLIFTLSGFVTYGSSVVGDDVVHATSFIYRIARPTDRHIQLPADDSFTKMDGPFQIRKWAKGWMAD
jgi:hypothetical protein